MGLPEPCFNLFMTLLVLYFLISFHSQTRTEAVATYLYLNYPNTTTFTTNSTYQSNLNHLLTYLSSNATRSAELFNATASTNNSIDTVYGLFLCRGNLPTDACQSCIASTTKDVVQRCPKEKVVVAWYNKCMFRYSNQYVFSNMVTDPAIFMWNTQNISEPNRFNLLVRATMNELASGISNVWTGAKKFGMKEANFIALQNMYTLLSISCIGI